MSKLDALFRLAPMLATLSVVGCAGDDTDGTAPSISNLFLTPTSLPAGQPSTMTGSLAFEDADADVLELGITVELPDTSRQTLPAVDVSNGNHVPAGTIQLALTIAPPTAGAYHLELWLVDVAGHESNRLGVNLQAQ